MFQKTCGATGAGSCTEPDHNETEAIVVKSESDQPNKFNELDYKDFDIVRAVQVKHEK